MDETVLVGGVLGEEVTGLQVEALFVQEVLILDEEEGSLLHQHREEGEDVLEV